MAKGLGSSLIKSEVSLLLFFTKTVMLVSPWMCSSLTFVLVPPLSLFPFFPFSLFSAHQTVAFDLSSVLYVAYALQTVYRGKEGGRLTLEDCDPVRRALRLNRVQDSAEVRQRSLQSDSPMQRIRLFGTLEFV